jgi:SAM-dependent methyltransferase
VSDSQNTSDRTASARQRLAERLLAKQGIRLGPAASAPAAPPPPVRPPASAEDAHKRESKQFYDGVTRQLDASMFGMSAFFLNLGYAPTDSPQRARIEVPPHAIDANSIRLVLETIGDFDPSGQRVLDVGCGRGGIVVTLLKHFAVADAVGLDLSTEAVCFCRRRHRFSNAHFTNGDSERLPFVDGSFDVVTNIESSHTYPTVESFYTEVKRVLRRGGHFLYSDLFVSEEKRMTSLRALLGLGFSLHRQDDITENVLRSCEEIAARRQAAFTHRNDTDTINNFLAAPGSWIYDGLKSGAMSFWIYRLRRGD